MSTFIDMRPYILFSLIAGLLFSCGNDLEVPNTEFKDPNIPESQITDIDAVKGIYLQNENITEITSDLYMEGYVISSDAGGNFFKQLILQDKPENPTSGILIEVDVNPLYTYFDIGRKVYVKLKGLYVGVENGIIKLGRLDNNAIGRISFTDLDKVFIRTPNVETIVAKELNIPQFADEFENIYVKLKNVQFNRYEVLGYNPKTFASEEGDQFDGERVLESCTSNSSAILSTSTYSNFKSLRLPNGSGNISGILTRDFYDDFYTIYLNTPEDIAFNSNDRCDPIEIPLAAAIDCEDEQIDDTLIYSQNFDSYTNFSRLLDAGWTNINLVSSNTQYSLAKFSGNTYIQITAFNSADANIDNWLISPEIDVSAISELKFNLSIQTSYDNGKILSILISDDFDGSIENSTWHALSDAVIPSGPANAFGEFKDVGPINLSCFNSDKLYVAFRYQGSDPSATTRYHIDNLEIKGR